MPDAMPTRPTPAAAPTRPAWLSLFRPPNLFTVPGDPLAGYLLALGCLGASRLEAGRLLLAAAVAVLLYGFGLLENDYFDLAEDRAQRPDRPLPSGRVSPRRALAVAVVLAVAALGLANWISPLALTVAMLLAAVITLYNRYTKHVPVLGPLTMGACRALSLLLGAAAAGGMLCPTVLLSGAYLLGYIAAVTHIASGETARRPLPVSRFLPWLVVAVWMIDLQFLAVPGLGWQRVMLALISVPPVLAAAWLAHQLRGEPEPAIVQRTIGQYIRLLLPVQAAIAMACPFPGWIVAWALLASWPLARRAGQRFYAS